jgi:TolA-binding protein
VLALFMAVAPLGRPAQAQMESREGIALQNQILELRRQVQILQGQGGGGRAPSPTYLGAPYPPPSPPSSSSSDLVTQLLARVEALEEQVRQLRGRIDETQNQVQRLGSDLSKKIDDMAFQLQNPQPGGAPPPRAPTSLPPPSPLGGPAPPPQEQPPQPPTRRTPEMALQEGNAALARRDYTSAEQAAREVLTGSRASPRAYDAQFLLAQALSGQRQYSQAAIAYDDAYNRSRKGAHAPDALLGLANALIAINEKRAACDTLTKLRAEYPSARPDIRDTAAAATQRAGCR